MNTHQLARYVIITPSFVALVLFYGLVIATRMEIGYWPKYHQPDAGVWSQIPYPYAHRAVLVCLALSFFSGPLFVAGAIVAKVKRWENLWSYAVVAIGAWILFVLIVLLDPGAFFNWFFD